jgi:hypothetical protein
MQVRVEQQLYPDILSFGSELWNNDTVFKMANESPQISKYHLWLTFLRNIIS